MKRSLIDNHVSEIPINLYERLQFSQENRTVQFQLKVINVNQVFVYQRRHFRCFCLSRFTFVCVATSNWYSSNQICSAANKSYKTIVNSKNKVILLTTHYSNRFFVEDKRVLSWTTNSWRFLEVSSINISFWNFHATPSILK